MMTNSKIAHLNCMVVDFIDPHVSQNILQLKFDREEISAEQSSFLIQEWHFSPTGEKIFAKSK